MTKQLQLAQIMNACLDRINYRAGQIRIDTFLSLAEFEKKEETTLGSDKKEVAVKYYTREEQSVAVMNLQNMTSHRSQAKNRNKREYNFTIQTSEGLKQLEETVERFYSDLTLMKDHETIVQELQMIYHGKKSVAEMQLEKNERIKDGINTLGTIVGAGIGIYTTPITYWFIEIPIKFVGVNVGKKITNSFLTDNKAREQLSEAQNKYPLVLAELEKRRPTTSVPANYSYGAEGMYRLIS